MAVSSVHDTSGDGGLMAARHQLTAFVVRQAAETRAREGFGWQSSRLAPTSFPAVRAEARSCAVTGLPYRVSSENCTDVVMTSVAANHADRFWHDLTHVRLGAGFDGVGERLVADAHLADLAAAGWSPSSLVWRLLEADTLGQVLLFEQTGRFPRNQLHFVVRVVVEGIDAAITAEVS